MISEKQWTLRLSKTESVYSAFFKTNNNEIVAACSNDLVFIDSKTGKVKEKKRIHHAQVYAVKPSHDKKYFASASADGMVVVWKNYTNESFINFGSNFATRVIFWNPDKNILVSLSHHEYHIWSPNASRASRFQTEEKIETGCFSTDGKNYAIGFSDGTVKVYSLDNNQVLQNFTFSAPVSLVYYMLYQNIEYLLVADIDRHVSMFRTSDKALIGKNVLPFEALTVSEIKNGDSVYLLFAGISGIVSLLTANLMYLDDFKIENKWVWNISISEKSEILLCGREGLIEMRTLKFPSMAAGISSCTVFKDNINSLQFQILDNSNKTFSQSTIFPQIIYSLSISEKYFLVSFKTGFYVYSYSIQNKNNQILNSANNSSNNTSNNDVNNQFNNVEEGVVEMNKICEVPGKFHNSQFEISNTHIFVADENKLIIYNINGIHDITYTFQFNITSLSKTSTITDGCIVGCKDGSIYFVILSEENPAIFLKHTKSILFAQKQNLILAFIDKNKELFVKNCFTNEEILHDFDVTSFCFSDHVDSLFAYSIDNSKIIVNYVNYKMKPSFIEGSIVSFYSNQIILSNGNSLEIFIPDLPFHAFPLNSNEFMELLQIGLSKEQWKEILKYAIENKNSIIASLAAQHCEDCLIDEYDFTETDLTEREKIIFKNETNFLNRTDFLNKRADELEKAGISEAAVLEYAAKGDWENTLRLVQDSHVERLLIDLHIPKEYSEKAAKLLLKAGLGDGAIKILQRSQNILSLAKTHVYLGQWIDAISLSRLNPLVYPIVYPKFGQKLFEHGNYFESLVCFFISNDIEKRNQIFSLLYEKMALSHSLDKLSFISLLNAFNNPSYYWEYQLKATAFYASHRLSSFLMMPMTENDIVEVFYLSYFVSACLRKFAMRGVHVIDVLYQLMLSSAFLGLKRWVAYALKELTGFSLPESVRQLAQLAVRINKENLGNPKIQFKCPKCQKDFYQSSRIPLLYCGNCGAYIKFSAYSCSPLSLLEIDIINSYNKALKNNNVNLNKSLNKSVDVEENDVAMSILDINEDSENDEFEIEKLLMYEPEDSSGDLPPPKVITEDYLRNLPPECCLIQKIKETANVSPKYWYNGAIDELHSCCNCGTIFNEVDYQNVIVDAGQCPICHSPIVDQSDLLEPREESDILKLLRNFEKDSPVRF